MAKFSLSSCPGNRLSLASLLISISFFSFPEIMSSQGSLFLFDHLTVDQSLTSNNTKCLLKDSQGYLWIGTDEGLNRYDGNHLKPFKHTMGDRTSLVNNVVITLFEDSWNRIWVGTGGGISILLPNSDKFLNFTKIYTESDTIDFKKEIKSIRQFKNKIWIATRNQVITCPMNSFSFTTVEDCFSTSDVVPIYFLNNQAITTSSAIWFLTSKGPYYTEDGETFIHRYNDPDHLPIFNYKWYSSIYNDGDSILYLSTFRYKGLYTYKIATATLDSIPAAQVMANDVWIRSLCRLNEKQLIGVTENHGAFTFDLKTGETKFYTPDPNDPNSLNSSHAEQILVDSDNVIFLATDHGLEYATSSKLPFTVLNTSHTGLKDMIVCIAEDNNGTLWMGTLKNGLFSYTPTTGEIKSYLFQGKYNNIWSLYFENNELLIGTSSGLGTFSTISKRFKPLLKEIPKDVQELTDCPSTNILKDPSGSYWIALFPYGLIKYNFGNKKFTYYNTRETEYVLPGSGTITASSMDNNGTLWLGFTQGELAFINTKDNAIHRLNNIPIDESEMTGKITTIVPDNKGHLWIGTSQAGLFEYDIASSTFTSYDTRQHLTSNDISSLVIDQDSILWINTMNGINKYIPKNKDCTRFDKSDGLPASQFSLNSRINISPIFKSRSGIIYSCSETYLVGFDPRAIGLNPGFPKLIFSSYSIAGKPYLLTSADRQINFTYQDKDITFDFSGINFIDPAKTQFEYMLEGYDEDWIKSESQPFASYTSLPVGKHLLRIRTTNKPGLWNGEEATMLIKVTGPFWKTGRFIALCLSLCALIFYIVYRVRLAQFKKIQTLRQKISRDLHDEIGSTLSSISINSMVAEKLSQQSKAELTPVLKSIGEHARTAMDNMNDIVWAINPANESFCDIIERIQIFASSLLEGKNIQLQIDIADSLQDVQLDMQQRKNIYLFLREAIHNVAKYSHARHCLISGSLQHKMIKLQVEDDGTGFEKTMPGLGGNGMSHMQERARELSAQFQVQSEKLKGTRVSLQFASR